MKEKLMPTRMSSLFVSLCLLTICLGITTQAVAQPGALDPSFGKGGIVTTDFGSQFYTSNTATITGAALQSDGKIIVVGGAPTSTDFAALALVRYNTDGTLDKSFGTGGIVTDTSIGVLTSIVEQSDGKIIVAGTPTIDLTVVRYNPNGTLDPSFGTAGIASFECLFTCNFGGTSALAIQQDGKIVVADGSLLRFTSTGQLDTTFGVAGIAKVAGNVPTAVKLLPNGKILVASGAANTGYVTRYTSNGVLDTSFAINGQLPTPGGSQMVLLGNAEFLVVGSLTSNLSGPTNGFAVSRYLPFGAIDTKFATHGGVVTPVTGYSTVSPTGLGVESTGDIVASGTATANFDTNVFSIVRYTAAGQLDTSFGNGGTVTTSFGSAVPFASALLIQSDDKIVVLGNSTTSMLHGLFDTNYVIARYLAH
jgi:uncharacterized delta-60 repeat protein